MERIRQKIGKIKEYVALIESIREECLEKFVADPIYRGALLHYLYLMADTCISLAELVISQRRLRAPQSYADSIDILGESGVLDPAFAYEFAKIAGFRNFLAHDYEKIDARQICSGVLSKLGDVERYVSEIQKMEE